jgi:hypothetical protein
MRTGLRVAALGLFVVVLALWFFGGMNRGWTKTSIAVARVDEVTEQSYQTWEKRFLPGIDFLGAGAGVSAVLMAASFLFARK